MERTTLQMLNEINRTIIQWRGVYTLWSGRNHISYNEMLVLYTIRETGFCTQKQICDNYLLPRQTINHVIGTMRQEGLLQLSREHSRGREKAFVLTEKGRQALQPVLDRLNRAEEQAVEQLGGEKLHHLTELMQEYAHTLRLNMTGED